MTIALNCNPAEGYKYVETALRRQRGHSRAHTQGPMQDPIHLSAATLGSHSHDLLLALCAPTTVPRRSHSCLIPPAGAGRVATWSEALWKLKIATCLKGTRSLDHFSEPGQQPRIGTFSLSCAAPQTPRFSGPGRWFSG